ncbi:hypothetical protein JQ629_14235 [Bradyrhizobium sp. AUGA SZCCT0222]|nr:hypothetical protein [Bradyrhizobium sp. AUGA SZCCT0222]
MKRWTKGPSVRPQLQVGNRLHRRVHRHHDAVAAALGAAREHADEEAASAGLLERHAVQRSRKIRHGAEIELAGHHLVGERRAAGEVLPLDVVGDILVFAVPGQELLQQLQLADQKPAGCAIDRRVLRPDRNTNGFGTRHAGQANHRNRNSSGYSHNTRRDHRPVLDYRWPAQCRQHERSIGLSGLRVVR